MATQAASSEEVKPTPVPVVETPVVDHQQVASPHDSLNADQK
jgi:hypothetical protein